MSGGWYALVATIAETVEVSALLDTRNFRPEFQAPELFQFLDSASLVRWYAFAAPRF